MRLTGYTSRQMKGIPQARNWTYIEQNSCEQPLVLVMQSIFQTEARVGRWTKC